MIYCKYLHFFLNGSFLERHKHCGFHPLSHGHQKSFVSFDGTLTDLKGKAAWVGIEHSQCHVGITTWRSSTGLPVKMAERHTPCKHYAQKCWVLSSSCIVLFYSFYPHSSFPISLKQTQIWLNSFPYMLWVEQHTIELNQERYRYLYIVTVIYYISVHVWFFFFSLFYFSFQDSSQMVYYISASIQTCSGFNYIAKELAGKVFIHWSWRNLQEQSSINALCFIVEAGAGMAFLGWCSGKQLGLTALAAQEYACNKWIYSTCVYNWLLFYISSVVLV